MKLLIMLAMSTLLFQLLLQEEIKGSIVIPAIRKLYQSTIPLVMALQVSKQMTAHPSPLVGDNTLVEDTGVFDYPEIVISL